MKKRTIVGGGFIGVTLGALGCGEPERAPELRPHSLFVKDLSVDDSLKTEGWRKYLDATTLHGAWVPAEKSPWRPYYKPTLIAAASIVREVLMPVHPPAAETVERVAAETGRLLDLDGAAVIVDLPGEQSVAWGAIYMRSGFQPVVTINNWPHQKGMLALERPLGALLYYAQEAATKKPAPPARPIFILEGNRLAAKELKPTADQFDNRFFHAISDFPSASVFKEHGIKRVIYVNPRGSSAGNEEDDLNEYFHQLWNAGIGLLYVTPGGKPLAVTPAARTTIFTPAETASYASSGPYTRHYTSYHTYFWARSPGGFGYGPGGGSGSSGLTGSNSSGGGSFFSGGSS